MKVEELKSALSSRELSTVGKKSDLLSRLLDSIQSESSSSNSSSSSSSSSVQEEGTARKKLKVEETPAVEPVPTPVPSTVKQDPVQISTNTSSSSDSQSTSTAWNLASADASLPAVRGRATVQLRATSGFSATAAALATNASSSANASASSSTAGGDAISPSGTIRNNDERLRVKCPYLDTINRHIIDTDMEKVCSVTLSNLHVYVCLVCGKYFQGRGKATPAYTHRYLPMICCSLSLILTTSQQMCIHTLLLTKSNPHECNHINHSCVYPLTTHSVQCGHFVFMNLHDGRAFCLPDGYEVWYHRPSATHQLQTTHQ